MSDWPVGAQIGFWIGVGGLVATVTVTAAVVLYRSLREQE